MNELEIEIGEKKPTKCLLKTKKIQRKFKKNLNFSANK